MVRVEVEGTWLSQIDQPVVSNATRRPASDWRYDDLIDSNIESTPIVLLAIIVETEPCEGFVRGARTNDLRGVSWLAPPWTRLS
jgi:hypothetical protein